MLRDIEAQMYTLKTVWFYVARQFFLWFIVAFFGLLSIVAIIDAVELLSRTSGNSDVGFGTVISMTFLRLPFLSQELAAFSVLFGSIMTFVRLTRSHELVVVRAAGISVWQFLLPALLVAGVIGVTEITLLNPFSSFSLAKYEEMKADKLTGRSSLLALSPGGSLWLRQVDDANNQAVIYADRVDTDILELHQVEITLLNPDNKFIGRIDAETARLEPGAWLLGNAWIAYSGAIPEFLDQHRLPTDLTLDKIHESFASPETISFWDLPKFISTLEATGFSGLAHRLQWHALLAEPFLLLSMVLIAATVSLRFTRQGGVAILVISGIAAGFGLFILTEIIHALGMGATLPIALAAWTPAGVSLMLGVSMLLHLEDG